LSNHDSGNGSILRQAQDERKPKKPITLHRPWLSHVEPLHQQRGHRGECTRLRCRRDARSRDGL